MSFDSMNSMLSLDADDNPDVLEQGYDEHFDPPAPDAYECPICLLILNKPMQTVCGHRFCRGCILKVLREGRQNCPIDNEVLSEQQIYPDNFARREILNLTVHCHNHKKHKCNWLGPLKDLKNHLENCDFTQIACPNSCGVMVARSELENHKINHCSRRIVACEYCAIKVVHLKLTDHKERCPRYPLDCPNGCDVGKVAREEMEHHMEFDCTKALVKCSFKDAGCDYEGNRTDLATHMGNSTSDHLNKVNKAYLSLKQLHNESIERIKQLETKDSGNATLTWNTRDGNIVKVEFDKLSSKVRDLELKVTQSKSLTEMYRNENKHAKSELEARNENLQQKVQELTLQISEMNARVWCGKFIWRISAFDSLFQQAKVGDVPAVHSLPFYTSVPGYKMCLRVNLNGIDSGANTHVSMFVHLMQGEFDSIIEWPFPGVITLTIMDQEPRGEPQHVKETLTARPALQAFLRPKTNRNHKGYGYVEMLPHTTLRERGYVLNNTMIVKVDVKMPPR